MRNELSLSSVVSHNFTAALLVNKQFAHFAVHVQSLCNAHKPHMKHLSSDYQLFHVMDYSVYTIHTKLSVLMKTP